MMADQTILSDGKVVSVNRKLSSLDGSDEKRRKVIFEKVVNVWGSGAGAGSDSLHIYRKHRFKEMDRLEHMDAEFKARVEDEEFQMMRVERSQKMEAISAKKSEKRRKRKAAAKTHANSHCSNLQQRESKAGSPRDSNGPSKVSGAPSQCEDEVETSQAPFGSSSSNITSPSVSASQESKTKAETPIGSCNEAESIPRKKSERIIASSESCEAPQNKSVDDVSSGASELLQRGRLKSMALAEPLVSCQQMRSENNLIIHDEDSD